MPPVAVVVFISSAQGLLAKENEGGSVDILINFHAPVGRDLSSIAVFRQKVMKAVYSWETAVSQHWS